MKLSFFSLLTPVELLRRLTQHVSRPIPNGAGGRLAITTVATALPALPDETDLVLVEAVDGALIVTFDGSIPSSTNGHALAQGDVVQWGQAQAAAARIATASGTLNLQWTPFS